VRIFPIGDKAGQVVWQGHDETRKPTELTSEDKNIIAHLANEVGVKKAVDYLGISMVILRAWQGSYLRKPVNKSKQSATKVDNGNLLPLFPAFSDKWEAPVQLEWLVTYLELAKLEQGRASDIEMAGINAT